jgi:dienelactone hydrolase
MSKIFHLVCAINVCLFSLVTSAEPASTDSGQKTSIKSAGWELIGDLRLPDSTTPLPGVLLLNEAAGNRQVYSNMALQLAKRGIASLSLDLRGHGDSINLGRFVPEESSEAERKIYIRDAETDVVAAHKFLKSHPLIDAERIAIVGASYSGEEMAEAGRNYEYPKVYVALSPGSFSDESISAMDSSAVTWLFVVSRHERYLKDIVAKVQAETESVEILYLPGTQHATRILNTRPDIAERIAVWLDNQL